MQKIASEIDHRCWRMLIAYTNRFCFCAEKLKKKSAVDCYWGLKELNGVWLEACLKTSAVQELLGAIKAEYPFKKRKENLFMKVMKPIPYFQKGNNNYFLYKYTLSCKSIQCIGNLDSFSNPTIAQAEEVQSCKTETIPF